MVKTQILPYEDVYEVAYKNNKSENAETNKKIIGGVSLLSVLGLIAMGIGLAVKK